MKKVKNVLYSICRKWYNRCVWEIKQTEAFGQWFNEIELKVKEDVYSCVDVLKKYGPSLGRPYVDSVNESRHSNMKELRVQSSGKPYRIFFAFDPRRNAVLLIGGNKSGNKRFYKKYIPIADDLFTEYLEDIKK